MLNRQLLIIIACVAGIVLIVLIEVAVYRFAHRKDSDGYKNKSHTKMRKMRRASHETKRTNKRIYRARLRKRKVRTLRIANRRRKIRKSGRK